MARREIIDGPSKRDLILSLSDGDFSNRKQVKFMVKTPNSKFGFSALSVVIDSAKREDGSGDNWLFEGFLPSAPSGTTISGCFSTKNRRGWAEVKDS